MKRSGLSTLSDAKILEKKYLTDGCEVYGYVKWPALENQIGISNQVPGTLGDRHLQPRVHLIAQDRADGGYREITLRRPKIPVNAGNVEALQLLDILTYAPVNRLAPDEPRTAQGVRLKVDRGRMRERYPGKTALRLLESEARMRTA